jgi:hypothetical protein
LLHQLFVIVPVLLRDNVAIIFPLVDQVVEYVIVHMIASRSIRLTVAVADQLFQTQSV